jgi:2-methylisocitrate lyase-like PEP mutase family enzyme
MRPTAALRRLLAQPGLLVAPGAHDAITARMVEAAGFALVYVGGQAASATMLGIADHSLITTTELWDHARRITSAVAIPVISDVDDAGPTPLSVQRTIALFEAAGVAAVHLEDHVPGKHLHDPAGILLPVPAMVTRLQAAVDARRDPDFVVIARCDGCVVGRPLDEVMERAHAYGEAGADLVFVPRLALEQVKRLHATAAVPVMAIAPLDATIEEIGQSGVKLAIYHNHGLLASLKAFHDVLTALKTHGTLAAMRAQLLPTDQFNRLVGTHDAITRARRYGILPAQS